MQCKVRTLSLQRSELQHEFMLRYESLQTRWLFLVLCFARDTADDNLLHLQLFSRLAQTIGEVKLVYSIVRYMLNL